MARPDATDFPPYFSGYINKVKGNELQDAFTNNSVEIRDQLSCINEEQSSYSYSPGKWTIKELLQHLIDAERVFGYRAVCIARGEKASLPSFDENGYARSSHANVRSWQSLLDEFLQLHRSTEQLFESFTGEMLAARGVTGDKQITVLSIGYIIIGHILHHLEILRSRYLVTEFLL